jgi:4-hydroxy-3-methylbut-2-enyl diphosphate reductase
MKVLLASPHGFCAGVVRAIDTLEHALRWYGPPLYVYHEIVHNKHVVRQFEQQGVVFVESLDDVPDGALLLFSAHGISPEVRQLAERRRLRTIDATCPLVAKVHSEAVGLARAGYTIVLIGHADHDEVVGTMGEAPERIVLVETPEQAESLQVADPARIAYLTQTTLSVDDANRIVSVLRRRFPHIRGPHTQDICYATQNRQDAVRQLARQAQLVLVLGSNNSSNSIRLVEVAQECGTAARLVDQLEEIDAEWLQGVETVLVTAGASAPEHLVWECVDWLKREFGAEFEEHRIREENVEFRLPNLLVNLDIGPASVPVAAPAPSYYG